jgi:hypothetical protein
MYVHLVALTVTDSPASTDGLDGDLARLQQWPRRRMAPFAHARRVAAPGWCGDLSGVRASAAAAVGGRTKASGRRVVRRFPAGAWRPLSAVCASCPAESRARSRAARRAARWARP